MCVESSPEVWAAWMAAGRAEYWRLYGWRFRHEDRARRRKEQRIKRQGKDHSG